MAGIFLFCEIILKGRPEENWIYMLCINIPDTFVTQSLMYMLYIDILYVAISVLSDLCSLAILKSLSSKDEEKIIPEIWDVGSCFSLIFNNLFLTEDK